MGDCFLTDKQKRFLRFLVSGLKDGKVKTSWVLQYGDNRFYFAQGPSEDIEINQIWEEARPEDISRFIKCDFIEVIRYGRYGPEHLTLNPHLIVSFVENGFKFVDEEQNVQHISDSTLDRRAVFVVHGRNELARKAMFNFLRSLHLKPLEWTQLIHETGHGTPYVGQVLDAAFAKAPAVIVLMTPDDEARLNLNYRQADDEVEFLGQARPNVIFEAGMAMGHKPEKTIIVEVGSLRPFSDIGGRHVIRLDNSLKQRQELINRLKTAGCEVDTSGFDWHSSGDFQQVIDDITRKTSRIKWERTGHLWWFCSDITHAKLFINSENADRKQIVDWLRRVHHHAKHLGLVNQEEELRKLKEEAISSSNNDWTQNRRAEISRQLHNIFVAVADLVKASDPEFQSDPD